MRVVLIVGLLLAPLLAGCADDDPWRDQEVSLTAGQVPIDSSTTRTLSCGERARIDIGLDGGDAGTLTVTVKDGAGVPVYNQEFPGGTGSDGADLVGSAGRWSLIVHRSLELGSDFTVTLTC